MHIETNTFGTYIFPLLLFIMGSVITVVVAFILGSNYLPTKKGCAKEKYMVTEIYDFRMKYETLHLSRLQLIKSSIKNACGFADIILDKEKIIFKHYAFTNNCFHNIIAPGFVLFDEDQNRFRASSNMFKTINITHNISSIPLEFIPKNYRNKSIECALLKIEYYFPKTYTGPLYESKDILFAKGIGILKAVTTYQGGLTDTFTLKRYRIRQASDSWWPIEKEGNYWVYNIKYSVGPNKCNINH